MKNRNSFRSSDIDNTFVQQFKSSKFYTEIYSKHKDEVIIAIRDGYICLYYNCDCISKIKPAKVLKGEINGYFTDNQTSVMTENSIINLYPLIKVQSDKRHKQEKQAQQQLYIQNNNNPNSNWFCVDVEFTKSLNGKKKAEDWRFDLIAITKTKPCRVALIELKYGNRAIGGKSGIRKHIKDFYEFYQNDNSGGFGFTSLKSEIIGIINALDKVGISIPQGLRGISENDIEPRPEFYFITLNNNPYKIGASCPKQTMSGYLFSDNRWGCKKISDSVIKDGDYYDITNKDRDFSPTFLFSSRTLPNLGITDILEDKSYEKEHVYPSAG